MRFLNKLIFINSATIRYAEVMVNGNVHLIGTQGVGKSTLLRAILFFYNADTLKLGISREKKSFAEYYFPFQNSYLVYEVIRETGPYCVIAFKSQGKVCFRFIDGAYDKKYFITGDGQAFGKWEDSRQIFDADNIMYSRKIDRYEEYRDILYGNNEAGKKEFVRYALLQSRQYQNIPRTIQNVFLNSKLEAEFIKQTIIMSLNEEDVPIDLQNYMHHLKHFEDQLADIQKYKEPSVQKLAENVVKYHIAIRHLEQEKNKFCAQLSWAIAQVKRNIPKLHEKIEKQNAERQNVSQKIDNAETRFRNKAEKIKGEISVLDSDLKKAKEKVEQYAKLNIGHLLAEMGKKKDYEHQLKNASKTLELYTSEFRELSQKYDALFLALENKSVAFEQEKYKDKVNLKARLLEDKEEVRKNFQHWVDEINQLHTEAEEQAHEAIDQQRQILQNEKLKKEAAKHQRFFEQEINDAQQKIQELVLSAQQAQQTIAYTKSRQETLQKNWQLDEDAAKQINQRSAEKLRDQISLNENLLRGIEDKLANSSDALYGWLNVNKKGWEQTIGKIASEEVLFSKELSPKLADSANHFYGVTVDLTEVPVNVKTIAEYEQEKASLQEQLNDLKQQQSDLASTLTEQLEKLRRKYQPQLKDCKDTIAEQQYKAEQDIQNKENELLLKKDLEIKAGEKKKAVLAELDETIAQATELLIEKQQALSTIRSEKEKQVKTKQREHDRRVNALEKEEKEAVAAIDEALEKQKQDYLASYKQLQQSRDAEMSGSGADTTRIAEIETQIKRLQSALDFIEKNRDVLAEYKKDKRELIDKVDDFKNRKALFEQQYETEEQKQAANKAALQNEHEQIGQQISGLQNQLVQANEDAKAFADFSVTDAYASIENLYKEEKDAYKTDKRCTSLIGEINRCHYNSIQRLDDLKESTNKFLGFFSAQNIFNFKSILTDRYEYLQFAEELNEFINNSKIEEFEKRVNERFATIIHSVGKETGTLMSKSGEIQKVINDINRDFDNKNFVGAIQKIELRLDESANKVVKLLLQVKQYNDEHAYDIGGLNLFSSIDQDAKNKKAVDLLKQLGKAVGEYKKDFIALSDTFELKFRIEENKNDTGWVEKLANVGSEGTDVLVKAMINIMLLNVFKEGASKRFKDFRLHCMMDEIGKLHPNNVKGILQFANDRNINLINGSPTENNALDYKHIYKLEKDSNRNTRIKRIISNNASV